MPHRHHFEREAHRAEIAQRYLRGEPQAAIAAALRISQSQVSRDLAVIEARWRRSTNLDLDRHKAAQLARIDELERTYWAEWERSRQPREITVSERVTADPGRNGNGAVALRQRDKAAIRREERLGDPAYLEGVRWCIEQRCKILGLYAPKEIRATGTFVERALALLAEVSVDGQE